MGDACGWVAAHSGGGGGGGAYLDPTPSPHPNRHGNQTTFNLNTLLANNIYQCDYFRAL